MTSQPSASAPVLVTERLSKTYLDFPALVDCSLGVSAGEVFGLLGPNGAGKSTFLRLVMGFLRPTSGTAQVLGRDCYRESVAVHRDVAYLPGDARLPRTMTGRQVLDFFARIRTGRSAPLGLQIAERLELDLRRRVMWMSTGMRQKLAVAVTLACPAAVVILDEPTANLDPTVRSEVLELVREAQQAGSTIIFSSHVLSEIEAVCNRVAIVRSGRVVHTQCLSELRRKHRLRGKLSGRADEPFTPPPEFADQVEIYQLADEESAEIVTTADLGLLMPWLSQLELRDVTIEPIGLQSVYDAHHRVNAVADQRGTSRRGLAEVKA